MKFEGGAGGSTVLKGKIKHKLSVNLTTVHLNQ